MPGARRQDLTEVGMARAKQVTCPVCEERFEIEPDLGIGDFTTCPSCYADLKILSLHPLEVEETSGVDSAADDDLGDEDEDVQNDDFGTYR